MSYRLKDAAHYETLKMHIGSIVRLGESYLVGGVGLNWGKLGKTFNAVTVFENVSSELYR